MTFDGGAQYDWGLSWDPGTGPTAPTGPAPWVWSYNGLYFGPGTNVAVAQVTGLGDMADVRNGDQPRPIDTGMVAGWDLLGARSITITGDITPGGYGGIQAAVDAVKAAFAPSRSSLLPLVFWLPGQSDARQIFCRCRKLSVPIDLSYQGGLASLTVQLDTVDPRIYDSVVQTPMVALPGQPSGVSFPLSFPETFGATSGAAGVLVATNAGNVETRPTLTISGGTVTNPRLTNLSTGQTVTLSIATQPTDVLTLSMDAQTVYLNGTADRTSTVVAGSQFWTLPPGSSQVQFTSSDPSPTGASLTVSFSSAWL